MTPEEAVAILNEMMNADRKVFPPPDIGELLDALIPIRNLIAEMAMESSPASSRADLGPCGHCEFPEAHGRAVAWVEAGRNVRYSRNGKFLVAVVDMSQRRGRSTKGKSDIIASSGGLHKIRGTPAILNLTVYVPDSKED